MEGPRTKADPPSREGPAGLAPREGMRYVRTFVRAESNKRMQRTLIVPGVLVAGMVAVVATPARAADASPEAQAELNQQLLSVEEQVDSLKEQVFRSRATLQLLQEIVASEPTGGSQAVVWYVNKAGSGYTVERVAVLLDGQARFAKDDTSGELTAAKELKISEGPLAPGEHTVTFEVRLRPTGYGLFKYAKNYALDVRSSYPFKVDVGKTCTVRGVLKEKSAAERFEDRASIDYELRCEKNADAVAR